MAVDVVPASSAHRQQRIAWIDVLRGAAVVLVVLVHAVGFTVGVLDHPLPAFAVFNDVLVPLRMPLLFLLSGMFVPSGLRKPARTYFAGKLARLAYPFVVWTIIFVALDQTIDATFTLSAFWQAPYGPFWFIQFLFLYYVIAYLCRWVHPVLFIAAAVVVLALGDLGMLSRIATYLVPFFVGVWIGTRTEAFIRFVSNRWVCTGLLVAATTASFASVMWGFGSGEPTLHLALAIAFSFGVIGVVRPVAERAIAAPVAYVGRRTISMFILHWPIQLAVVSTLADAGVTSVGVMLPAVFGFGVAIPVAIMLLADRFPVLDWLFEWRPRARGTASRAQREATR